MNSETKDIVKVLKELTRELKLIRKVIQSWDEEPELDAEADPDEYII